MSVQAGDNDDREIFMLNPDLVARFVVPYKQGFDKSNRYIKHVQT